MRKNDVAAHALEKAALDKRFADIEAEPFMGRAFSKEQLGVGYPPSTLEPRGDRKRCTD